MLTPALQDCLRELPDAVLSLSIRQQQTSRILKYQDVNINNKDHCWLAVGLASGSIRIYETTSDGYDNNSLWRYSSSIARAHESCVDKVLWAPPRFGHILTSTSADSKICFWIPRGQKHISYHSASEFEDLEKYGQDSDSDFGRQTEQNNNRSISFWMLGCFFRLDQPVLDISFALSQDELVLAVCGNHLWGCVLRCWDFNILNGVWIRERLQVLSSRSKDLRKNLVGKHSYGLVAWSGLSSFILLAMGTSLGEIHLYLRSTTSGDSENNKKNESENEHQRQPKPRKGKWKLAGKLVTSSSGEEDNNNESDLESSSTSGDKSDETNNKNDNKKRMRKINSALDCAKCQKEPLTALKFLSEFLFQDPSFHLENEQADVLAAGDKSGVVTLWRLYFSVENNNNNIIRETPLSQNQKNRFSNESDFCSQEIHSELLWTLKVSSNPISGIVWMSDNLMLLVMDSDGDNFVFKISELVVQPTDQIMNTINTTSSLLLNIDSSDKDSCSTAEDKRQNSRILEFKSYPIAMDNKFAAVYNVASPSNIFSKGQNVPCCISQPFRLSLAQQLWI